MLPVKIGLAVNALAMTGGSITVSVDVPKPLEVVFGPVSVEETLLLTFVYDPAEAPVTVTLIVQVPLAAIVPLEREIVRGEVVVRVPPLQAEEVAELTVKPEGKTSEKETPVSDVPVLGLVSVNVSTLVLPVPIEVGEKLLDRFGTVGRAQPVITMLSSNTVDVVLALFLVSAWIVNRVVLLPVVAAVAVAPVCHDPFEVTMDVADENVPPSALEYT